MMENTIAIGSTDGQNFILSILPLLQSSRHMTSTDKKTLNPVIRMTLSYSLLYLFQVAFAGVTHGSVIVKMLPFPSILSTPMVP